VSALVYIETSIPSFYHEVRTNPEMAARREWTRQWWNNVSNQYSLVTSVAVLDEFGDGDYPGKDDALDLIKNVPLVLIDEAINDTPCKYHAGFVHTAACDAA